MLSLGRSREIAEIERLVSSFSLVTLIRSGSIGKTRLAIEAAAALEDCYPGAVWFTSLADISDSGLIMGIIASALGLRGLTADRTLEEVAKVLSQQPSFLVLDNLEHVVDGGTNVVIGIWAVVWGMILYLKYDWRCPRCGKRFHSTWWLHNTPVGKCLHCNLPKYARKPVAVG